MVSLLGCRLMEKRDQYCPGRYCNISQGDIGLSFPLVFYLGQYCNSVQFRLLNWKDVPKRLVISRNILEFFQISEKKAKATELLTLPHFSFYCILMWHCPVHIKCKAQGYKIQYMVFKPEKQCKAM